MVNAHAGTARGAAHGATVARRLSELGHDVRTVEAATPDEAISGTRALIAEGIDAVVVSGGDGSVHVALNAVLPGTTRLGIVPAGTGNDFARALALPQDPAAAVALIDACLRSDALAVVDVVEARDGTGERSRWFAGALSAGFDAVVSERANRLSWLPSFLRYNVAALLELPRYRARRYVMRLDGEPWEVDAMLVTVANTSSYGNGMQIAPDASISDGLLDVVVVTPLPKLRFLLLFPKVYKGAHVGLPYVQIRRAARVEVTVPGDPRPIMAHADGEPLWPLPATVEVRGGVLAVLAGAREAVDPGERATP